MRTRQSLALVGIFTIMLFLSGFGTEVWGQTYTTGDFRWISSVSSGNWNLPGNWEIYDGSTTTWTTSTTTYPSTSSHRVWIESTTEIALNVSHAINSLFVDGSVTLTSDLNTLSVGLLLQINSGEELIIKSSSTDQTYCVLKIQSSGKLYLDGGVLNAAPYGSAQAVRFQVDGQIQMSTLQAQVSTNSGGTWSTSSVGPYIGPNVRTCFFANNQAPVQPFVSDVLFFGSITMERTIALGSKDLFLGDGAIFNRTGNQGVFVATTDQEAKSPTVGRICKSFNGLVSSTTYFQYPIGPTGSNGTLTPFDLQVEAWGVSYLSGEQTSGTWPNPSGSSTTPFPYVSVRVVAENHPENIQPKKFKRYWVVQGVGTPDLDQGITTSASCCNEPSIGGYVRINTYLYYQPGDIQGSPTVSSSRWADNYEDISLTSATGAWDAEGSTTATHTANRQWIEMYDVTISHLSYSGSGTPCPGITTGCTTAGSSDEGWGDFTVGIGGPVPVELTSFSARWFDGAVRLNWQTATEINNFGFAIERSEDGEHWNEVGFVPGHGNSSSPKFYEHMDVLEGEALHMPKLAYRLRQMDRDGTTEYSNIVFVNMGELPEGIQLYAAYPNPFNPATTISFAIGTPSNVTLKVYNTLGQTVATLLAGSAMDAGLHTVPFDGATLPSGVYMAVLEADGAVQHQKLVLNK